MIRTSVLRLTVCVHTVLWYLCIAKTYSVCTHCALGFVHGLLVSAESYLRVHSTLWDLCMIRTSLLRLTVYVHTVLWDLCMIRTSVLRLAAMYIMYSVGIYALFVRLC